MMSRLSYVCTPVTEAYIYQSVPDRLRKLAQENPDREAFVFYTENKERTSISRKELYERSTSLARVLVGLGMEKRDKVGFCMNNSINMLIANMAAVAAGGIPFFTATNLKDGSDIAETLNDMEARMLFIDTSVGDDNWKVIQNFSKVKKEGKFHIPTLEKIICNGNEVESTTSRVSLLRLLEEQDSSSILPTVYPEDLVAFFFTSGSTGKPKAVAYTHFNLLNFTHQLGVALQIKPESVYFCDRSFSWVVGYPRTYLADGTTRVFVDTKLSLSGEYIETLCDIIEDSNCDAVYLPGYVAVDLLNNPQLAGKFRNVNSLGCSGERAPKLYANLKDKFCKYMYYYYGSTESGISTSFYSHDLNDYEDGLIGKPLSGMEMKIVDGNGDVVEVGQSGEMKTRSAFRFVDYANMPEKFREVVDQRNWLSTGDIAHMREDGNIIVDGRTKEMISMQTFKFFPWEVEKSLRACPGAKYAVAVGVPDVRLTQVICACVVPDEGFEMTEDNIKSFCDATFLEEGTANRLTIKPRYHLVLDNLPLTMSGKVDRRKIQTLAKDRLGL